MEQGPFEDVFPIENGDIPASYVSLLEGIDSWPFCVLSKLLEYNPIRIDSKDSGSLTMENNLFLG